MIEDKANKLQFRQVDVRRLTGMLPFERRMGNALLLSRSSP